MFNNYLEQIGLNLSSFPKNNPHQQLIEFLELANFLQKHFSNSKHILIRTISHGCLYTGFGIILLIFPQFHPLLHQLGYLIFLSAVVYIAINLIHYKAVKQIWYLANTCLSNCLITV
jgi:hypothetical protein